MSGDGPAAPIGEPTAEQVNFIKNHFGREHEQVFFMGWVQKLKRRKKVTKREPRLLVVGAYRILTLKGGKGRAIAREGHLLQLKKLSSDSPVHAKLEFSDFVFEWECQGVDDILVHVRRAYACVTIGCPPSETMNVAVNRPGDTGSNNLAAEAVVMAAVDRVAQNYAGLTEAFRAQWLLEGLDFQSFNDLNLHLELGTVDLPKLLVVSQADPGLRVLANALRFNRYFTGLRIWSKSKKREDILQDLAPVFASNTTLTELSVRNVPLDRGFRELLKALASNKATSLESVLFVSCPMRDKLLTSLTNQLVDLARLSTLVIANCELKPKGVAQLFATLEDRKIGWGTLTTINLSLNHVGRDGTEALVSWMSCSNVELALEKLLLSNSRVDMSALLNALHASVAPYLNNLDISKNPDISSDELEALSDLLPATAIKSLRVDESPHGALVSDLIMGMANRADITLQCRSVRLSGEIATNLSSNTQKLTNIKAIYLSDCDLGGDGVFKMAVALRTSENMLEQVSFSRNIRADDESCLAAMKQVGKLITACQHLQSFEMGGAGNLSVGTSITPVLQAISGHRNLEKVDVSNNRSGDNVALLLGDALSLTTCKITSLLCVGNGISDDGFEVIGNATKHNSTLRVFQFPDFGKKKKRPQWVLELKQALVRNIEAHRQANAPPPVALTPTNHSVRVLPRSQSATGLTKSASASNLAPPSTSENSPRTSVNLTGDSSPPTSGVGSPTSNTDGAIRPPPPINVDNYRNRSNDGASGGGGGSRTVPANAPPPVPKRIAGPKPHLVPRRKSLAGMPRRQNPNAYPDAPGASTTMAAASPIMGAGGRGGGGGSGSGGAYNTGPVRLGKRSANNSPTEAVQVDSRGSVVSDADYRVSTVMRDIFGDIGADDGFGGPGPSDVELAYADRLFEDLVGGLDGGGFDNLDYEEVDLDMMAGTSATESGRNSPELTSYGSDPRLPTPDSETQTFAPGSFLTEAAARAGRSASATTPGDGAVATVNFAMTDGTRPVVGRPGTKPKPKVRRGSAGTRRMPKKLGPRPGAKRGPMSARATTMHRPTGKSGGKRRAGPSKPKRSNTGPVSPGGSSKGATSPTPEADNANVVADVLTVAQRLDNKRRERLGLPLIVPGQPHPDSVADADGGGDEDGDGSGSEDGYSSDEGGFVVMEDAYSGPDAFAAPPQSQLSVPGSPAGSRTPEKAAAGSPRGGSSRVSMEANDSDAAAAAAEAAAAAAALAADLAAVREALVNAESVAAAERAEKERALAAKAHAETQVASLEVERAAALAAAAEAAAAAEEAAAALPTTTPTDPETMSTLVGLQNDREAAVARIEALRAENAQLATVAAELETAQAEASAQKDLLERLRAARSGVDELVTRLRESANEERANIEAQEAALDALQARAQTIELERGVLETENAAAGVVVEELKATAAGLAAEREAALASIAAAESEVTGLRERAAELEQEKSELSRELASADFGLGDLRARASALAAERASLEAEASGHEEALQQLRDSAGSKAEVAAKVTETEAEVEAMNQRLAALATEQAELQDQVTTAETELASLQTAAAGLLEQRVAAEAALAEADGLAAQAAVAEAAVAEATARANAASEAAQAAEAAAKEAEARETAAASAATAAVNSADALEAQVVEAEKRAADLAARLEAATAAAAETEGQLSEADATRQAGLLERQDVLAGRLAALETEVAAAEASAADLDARKAAAEAKAAALKADAEAAEAQVAALEARLAGAQARTEAIEAAASGASAEADAGDDQVDIAVVSDAVVEGSAPVPHGGDSDSADTNADGAAAVVDTGSGGDETGLADETTDGDGDGDGDAPVATSTEDETTNVGGVEMNGSDADADDGANPEPETGMDSDTETGNDTGATPETTEPPATPTPEEAPPGGDHDDGHDSGSDDPELAGPGDGEDGGDTEAVDPSPGKPTAGRRVPTPVDDDEPPLPPSSGRRRVAEVPNDDDAPPPLPARGAGDDADGDTVDDATREKRNKSLSKAARRRTINLNAVKRVRSVVATAGSASAGETTDRVSYTDGGSG